MKKAKGQSSIEALLLSLIISIIVQGGLLLFWVWVQFLWMDHQVYQGLVCQATKQKASYCHKTTLKKIKKIILIGQINKLELKELNKVWKGSIHWSFYKWDFYIKNQLNLSFL